MPGRLDAILDSGPLNAQVQQALREHADRDRPLLERLWAYYRNPLEPVGMGDRSRRGWYRLAQEAGLPDRVTGARQAPWLDDRDAQRREVVIENDIAWRIHTMVDFLFGRDIRIVSDAPDPDTRRNIELALQAVWHASGAIALLQDAATLAHVYGHVDLAVRIDEQRLLDPHPQDPAQRAADAIRIEAIDATRGVPVVAPDDYRRLDAYAIRVEHQPPAPEHQPTRETPAESRRARLFGRAPRPRRPERARPVESLEVFTPGLRRTFENRALVSESRSVLLPDTLPIVHVQNVSQPLRYSGLSEVEALIPLQDELNTRLSDRASRVTMHSFRMFLAKGIDGFDRVPVGPGALWQTDNPDASIQAFDADASSPSEEAHIREIREAMDKISAVPPLASGVLKARIGNLSSATALRVTLLSLLAKTDRKRVTFARGIADASRIVLDALDAAALLPTNPAHRAVRVLWRNPLPIDDPATTNTNTNTNANTNDAAPEPDHAHTTPALR